MGRKKISKTMRRLRSFARRQINKNKNTMIPLYPYAFLVGISVDRENVAHPKIPDAVRGVFFYHPRVANRDPAPNTSLLVPRTRVLVITNLPLDNVPKAVQIVPSKR